MGPVWEYLQTKATCIDWRHDAASPIQWDSPGVSRLHSDEMPVLVWAASTLGTHGAVIVCTEINCLAAERAAVVDKRLILLDGHGEYWFVD